MTTPAPEAWLTGDMVKAWLKLSTATSAADVELLETCAAAAMPQVERRRPDQFRPGLVAGDAPVFDPDTEVRTAGVMLAARIFRRRNSPSGVETFADTVSFVSNFDPEIDRALRVGRWQAPQVG